MIATTILGQTTPPSQYNLVDLHYRNQTSKTGGIINQSLFGGAQFFIKSSGGMDMYPEKNAISLTSSGINGGNPTFSAPLVNNDDAYVSNTMAGLLGYTTPAAMDLFSSQAKKFTYYDFDGKTVPVKNYFAFDLTIANSQQSLKCSSAFKNCLISYNEDFTPQLFDTVPSQIYFNQKIAFMLNPKACHNKSYLPENWDPFYYLKIGQVLTNWSGQVDCTTRLSDWVVNPIFSFAGPNRPTKSVDPDINFNLYGKVFMRPSSNHCNFAGNQCWHIRVHPRIDSISAAQGYLTGGQSLTIKGFGLLGTTSTVTVDGVSCNVNLQLSTDTSLVCETGPKATASVKATPQPGQPGITYTKTTKPPTVVLATAIETLMNDGAPGLTHTYEGWFLAPQTGNYRFFTTADDQSTLYLDSSNPYNPSAPTTFNPVQICQSNTWTIGYRQYDSVPPYLINTDGTKNYYLGNYQSSWIALTGGNYYKFKAVHVDGGGGYYFSPAVEFQNANAAGQKHPMATRAVQNLKITQTQVAEKWTLIIQNPGTGQFLIYFTSPKQTTTKWQSGLINCNSSAGDLRGAIVSFFNAGERAASDINVVLVMTDSAGAVTTTASKATLYTYTIQLTKRITGLSFSAYQVVTKGTISSVVQIIPPSDPASTQSSAPLSGNFVVQCADLNNVVYTSDPISYDNWPGGIQNIMDQTMSVYLKGKFRLYEQNIGSVSDNWQFSSYQNGRNLFLVFDGLDFNPPQCTIQSDSKTPITGNNVQFVANTVRPYGEGYMFNQIGTEFIRSDAQQPQVLVNVDELPALCPILNCDYAYIAATATITGQTFDASTKILTVTGTALSTTQVSVMLGGVTCASSPEPTFTATQIQCTLANSPRAGSHKAEVRDLNGLIPYGTGVADIVVPLVVSLVTPSLVNALGGDVLTIKGSGFPLQTSFVTVTFDDKTVCQVLTTTPTTITCKVQGMSSINGNARKINVNINNFRYQTRRELQSMIPVTDSSSQVGQATGQPKILSIDKTNVSPIIKQTLTFQLSNDYADTLNAADISIKIQNSSGYSRDLYVMSVDDPNNTITVKFNGAPIGTYTFSVTANSTPSKYGILDTSAISFQTSSTVTNISPSTGSVLGGTLLTITGTNFSTTILDQAVSITTSPDHYTICDILTATTTQLTCRIRPTGFSPTDSYTGCIIAVVLAASTTATCPGSNCAIDLKAPLETITSLTPAFDSTSNSIQITAVGTGFTAGDTKTVSLYIDNVQQTTTSVASATSAVFTISSISDVSSKNVAIYFVDGSPTGYNTVTTLTFTQNFVSVSPNTGGSQGGTLLTVKGTGFGKLTSGLGLYDVTTKASLCQTVVVTGYGTFTCFTKPLAVATTDTIAMLQGTTQITCSNSDTTLCQFTQLAASSPQVTSASVSGNVIALIGTAFPSTTGYTAHVIFKSIKAVVSGWSSTSATATFTNGVPAADSTESIVPQIQFTRTSDNVIFIAYSTGVTLTNTVTIATTDSTSGLTSSFAGGLSYTITKANIYATLLQPGNSITVCGNVCTLDSTKSDSTKAVCSLPPLATTYSAQNYKIVQSGILTGTWTAQVQTQVVNVYDGVWPTEYTDSGVNCFIQLNFPVGQVGVLDSVKVEINNLKTDKTPFAGISTLSGYDGTKWVTIWTLDNTINEGWNTQVWTTNKPSYQKYKWSGTTAGSCRFGEIQYQGIAAVADTNTSTSCTPILLIGTTSTNLSPVTYSSTVTPTITTITPRYGKVTGSETVTIAGTNFVSGSTSVIIDGITCQTTSVTPTQILCTTGKRLGDYPNPTFNVMVTGSGLAATQGNTFTYVQYWSDPTTWGNDAPPQFGEAVSIPVGRTLLVDVDVVPELSYILVEGSIIFAPHADPTHQRTFDAGYIFINGGYMEVGTELFPYTSKLTITMHGDKTTPAIPTYGNKNIAVRKGTLLMVGKERKVTWTMLDTTAKIGDTSITLQSQTAEAFDWAIGEQIVIASTSFDHNEAEVKTIKAVGTSPSDSTKPVLTLDSALTYKHYAATETYGTQTLDMRAEVGLLTRNVKYQGDPETSPKNLYGAHIMFFYPEDESCIGRILYIEFFNVGQAYQLGRYPIHFHMIGSVSKSLVKGNAIHQTYNRAVTIHAVKYFNIVQNVVYNTMGHSIFVEDAIETENRIDGNLVIGTHASWSLLNTDQTPASFWITHPNNIYTNNHAAGSDQHGFWYDTKEHPINGSFTPTICPENDKIGENRNNVAHSNGRYGLWIFHKLKPRARPCDPWIFDNSNPSAAGSPYPSNPAIPAVFYNFVAWKNQETGIMIEETGAVTLSGCKAADNLVNQMEWADADFEVLSIDTMLITGGLVVGKSGNTELALDNANVRGIVGPRWDFFTVRNVAFYNFNFGISGALGDCSHCFHPAATDSGARTYYTSGLIFDALTVPKKIWYQYPNRGIWSDLDGSLTGLGAGSWATAYFKHNEQPECTTNLVVYDGILCPNTVQVRRLAFHNMQPGYFQNMNLKIAKYDDSVMNALTPTAKTTYLKTEENFSSVFMKAKKNPLNSWTVAFVTGHKYRFYWDKGQLDYSTMDIEVSPNFKSTDSSILFNVPFIGNYEDIDFYGKYGASFTKDGTGPLFYASGSLQSVLPANQVSGANSFDNTVKEINFVINGATASSKKIESQAVVCRENQAAWCVQAPVVLACTGNQLNWSDPNTWITTENPAGGVPTAGQSVVIPSGVIVVFDIAQSPILNILTVNGCLQFRSDNTIDQELRSYYIYVQGGSLTIGSSTVAYTKKAKITLFGEATSQAITMSGADQQGNKILSNVGKVQMYGKSRSRNSRLQAEALKGSTSVTVDKGLDWVAGDLLGFAPTASQWQQSEKATIKSYDSTTGALVLTTALQFYHFGAATSTAANYQGLDMRGEVTCLTRSIVIQGDNTLNDWAGYFYTADAVQMDSKGNTITLSGLTQIQNVEFFNMGQLNNFKAAIFFENSQRPTTGDMSFINGVSIHDCAGWGIHTLNSANISFQNSDIFGASQIGVGIESATNVVGDGVNVFNVARRPLSLHDNVTDRECCVAICSFTKGDLCTTSTWKNSIVAGCPFAGIIAPGYSCNDTVGQSKSLVIMNNIAHSSEKSGWIFFPNPNLSDSKTCFQGSDFKGYKNGGGSVASFMATDNIIFSNLVSVDNTMGVITQNSGETDNPKKITLQNAYIYGESSDIAKDCPDGPTAASCYCPAVKMGVMDQSSAVSGKDDPHIPSASARPIEKIKNFTTWTCIATTKNVNFYNFKSATTSCGAKQSAFAINKDAPDHVPIQNIQGCTFTNVAWNALIYIYVPPDDWANVTDCGNFPCTGPNNAVYSFTNAVFAVNDGVTTLPSFWTAGTTTSYNFQIVSNVPAAVSTYPNCVNNIVWNAWFCADPAQTANPQVGQILFESLDGDTLNRSVQPIVITNSKGFRNTLNSYMDHFWDGFYSSQKRLSRFPSQVQVNQAYTINYTGTPPKNARYVLYSNNPSDYVIIKVPYANAGAYSVKVGSNIIDSNPMDSSTSQPSVINPATAKCGTNRFVGVQNYLEFYVTSGCVVIVIPRDAILTSVRLAWTAAEFFAGDGATNFCQRLASVLGIDASRVKIVSVYEGSLNLGVQILDNQALQTATTNNAVTATPASLSDLTTLSQTLLAVVTTGSTTLGAPVLTISASVQSNAIVNTLATGTLLQPGSAISNFACALSSMLVALTFILL